MDDFYNSTRFTKWLNTMEPKNDKQKENIDAMKIYAQCWDDTENLYAKLINLNINFIESIKHNKKKYKSDVVKKIILDLENEYDVLYKKYIELGGEKLPTIAK